MIAVSRRSLPLLEPRVFMAVNLGLRFLALFITKKKPFVWRGEKLRVPSLSNEV
jgi:hypothetical protein